MKKLLVLLIVSCLICMNSFGDEINLQKTQADVPVPEGKPKAPALYSVTAWLENEVLTLSFTPSSSCQVVITDSQTNTVVYSGVFGVDSTQTIPLTTLPAGEYELSVLAYGTWWEGEFEIE